MLRRLPVVGLLLVLVSSTTLFLPARAASRCFPETQQCLDGQIRAYWEANGGLPVFGFPVSIEGPELNRDTGNTYQTQWMERNRMEIHPENTAPYNVLLGRLGDDRLRQLAIDWQTLPKANPGAPHFFAASGHAIAHEPFWRYWSTRGLELGDRGVSERESLALFGLPISEPRTETNSSGDTVLTQWFERARFEDHGAKGVLLGLLGNEVRAGAAPTIPNYPATPAGLVTGTIVNVVDGDTADVQLNGQVTRLRLIGMDTPETVDPRKPVQCFGREASNKAKELLSGKTVQLEADASQDERDIYNRLLRYVWLPDGKLFNLEMIAQGYAHEYTYEVPYKYQTVFKDAQRIAREHGMGLWSPATCNGNTEQPAPSPPAAPSPTAAPLPPRPSSPPPPPPLPSSPPPQSGNCHPSYPDFCIPPPPPDLDCPDIPRKNFRVLRPDVHRFDGDGDGIGCES